jgi:hypothetical protein
MNLAWPFQHFPAQLLPEFFQLTALNSNLLYILIGPYYIQTTPSLLL